MHIFRSICIVYLLVVYGYLIMLEKLTESSREQPSEAPWASSTDVIITDAITAQSDAFSVFLRDCYPAS